MIQGKYYKLISFIGTSIIFSAKHSQLGPVRLINALIVGAGYHELA
jgi:hypothetical protein